ncbi:MAG: adenosylmethionine--8-amino-7-oxononanoate transaminase [Chitinophagales bacterium]|nr:adenosylmethionine--8-amino-7-oxononanoate transaminase [Chitinophagales bacterium]
MHHFEEENHPIWHPFTQMKIAAAPIHIDSAKGSLLYTKDGRAIIDAVSSWWVNIHGHAHPHIAEAIAKQAHKLEQVIFAGFTHQPAIDLANKLIEILPPHFSKVFFSDNGSTCVEVAIKMSLQYWDNQDITHKTNIIAFENAYHGDTFGAMSVGGKSTFNKAFQKHLFKVHHIPLPTAENIESVKAEFTKLVEDDSVAAFIFEPLVQGAAGMLMYEAAHLDALLAIAKEHNVICIADEVMTGFGRTGKNFAIECLKNHPDIICLSKGITGGFMPLGVTVCTQYIYDAFYSNDKMKTFFHGHSYTANPLACAAANASMQLLLSDECTKNIARISASHALFAKLISAHPSVQNVRQTGTILAFDIVSSNETSYFNSISTDIYAFFLSHNILLRPLGNVIYILPPYCISDVELNKVYEMIELFLNHLALKV